MFIIRGILQLLATGKANVLDDKLADAQDVLQSYDAMRPLPRTPLIHCIQLLIKVGMQYRPVCLPVILLLS